MCNGRKFTLRGLGPRFTVLARFTPNRASRFTVNLFTPCWRGAQTSRRSAGPSPSSAAAPSRRTSAPASAQHASNSASCRGKGGETEISRSDQKRQRGTGNGREQASAITRNTGGRTRTGQRVEGAHLLKERAHRLHRADPRRTVPAQLRRRRRQHHDVPAGSAGQLPQRRALVDGQQRHGRAHLGAAAVARDSEE